ncbi:hypothetical protein GXP67_08325 [Rhodocytophaga rosea]|uniref:TonB C-terminal domain-containing protein n=1 Tax=Rhodocytophaga rosea TaxID=2704465 RepID=A0A6C0GFU6_9BACT|nr:energy transducer TonB [Rhodocytophaga rosea]QHT66663.1 hypothetical protein GXP67_08325 [Rhodocytophaga rosea]
MSAMKTNLIFGFSIILLSFSLSYGQPNNRLVVWLPLFKEAKVPDNKILPVFPGGENALNNYFYTNLKQAEKELGEPIIGFANYESRVSFVLDENGKVQNIELVTDSPNFAKMDQKLIEMVKKMPDWVPYVEAELKKSLKVGLVISYNDNTAHLKFD